MAVIQISKIQQRRGQTAQTGFPQLSSGELGWSIDTQQLYIGNGAVSEGAPAVGNTQIITENNVTNFFKFANTSYRYGDSLDPNSGIVNSGIGSTRTLQQKLDDFINLNDFGDITATTDHTSIIQNAITYISETAKGKPLYFPEHTYTVTATIYIPPLTEIRGAGSEKTIIYNVGTATTFQTVSADNLKFDTDGGVALSTSQLRPKNIRINGISVINTNTGAGPLLQLDCIADSIIEQCEFLGGDIDTASTATGISTPGINIRDVAGSFPANTVDNLIIKNNKFKQLSNAVYSDYSPANIVISENQIYNLDMGVVFGMNLVTGAAGAQHVQIANNTFEYINNQAIYVGSTSTLADINSINNWFYDVGNYQQGDTTATQVTEIITFNNLGNYSNGDSFDRLDKLNADNSYVTGAASVQPLVNGPYIFKTKAPLVKTLSGTGGGNPFFSFPRSTYQYNNADYNQTITVEYTITCPYISLTKRGTLEVTVDGTTTYVKDTSTANDTTNGEKISFSASVDATKNLVTIYYYNGTATPATQRPTTIYTYTVRQ